MPFNMEARRSTTGPAAAMLALGALLAPELLGQLGKWEALAPQLRAFDLAFALAAAVLLVSGARLLVWARGARAVLFAGSAAALVLGGGRVAAMFLNAIPCTGSG
jgi:hypothetical protein